MILFAKELLSSNDKTFQVLNAQGHKIWVPRSMVNVKDEGDGRVVFEAPDALARQVKLTLGPDDDKLRPQVEPDKRWNNNPPTVERRHPSASDPGAAPRPGDPGALPRPTRPANVTDAQRDWAAGHAPTAQFKPAFTQAQLPFEPEALIRPKFPIVEGRYTVVFNGDVDDYVTLRVSRWESRPEALIFSFLRGPDNSTDYAPFSELNLKTLKYRVWNNFRHEGFKRQVQAARALLDMTEEQQFDAGETYALRSSNCCKCGRDLTVAKSIKRGMGSDCWQKYAPLTELMKEMKGSGKSRTTVIVTSKAGHQLKTLDEMGGTDDV